MKETAIVRCFWWTRLGNYCQGSAEIIAGLHGLQYLFMASKRIVDIERPFRILPSNGVHSELSFQRESQWRDHHPLANHRCTNCSSFRGCSSCPPVITASHSTTAFWFLYLLIIIPFDVLPGLPQKSLSVIGPVVLWEGCSELDSQLRRISMVDEMVREVIFLLALKFNFLICGLWVSRDLFRLI